ncbi:MAG: Fe-S cluster assembly protein SufD, partial [Terriglobia bacterium]
TAAESYFADFAAQERASDGPSWLMALRKSGMESFAELGFPTTHQEAWRFTNTTALAQTRFRPALPVRDESTIDKAVEPVFFSGEAARLVFVNGHLSSRFSWLAGLPRGVRVMGLRRAIDSDAAMVEYHLGRFADGAREAFVALNAALFADGAFIQIADGVALEKPIHVVHLQLEDSEGTVSHPRNLVLAGRDAQALVIESYWSSAEEKYFTNAVTEIVLDENSSLEHVRLQQESEQAFHVGNVVTHQGRASRVLCHSISLGAQFARHDIRSVLAGEGAECTLNGLYQVRGRQHVDHHTTLDHAMPHCGSREYYRGVLDGKSSAVFSGAILVRKDAQKTDAIQSNKNLLLSEEATINTKPELQILADDVRCTHGATVGQLDPDAIFYLRSRGIGLEPARHLLTRAFASDVIARIHFAPVRDRLEATLLARLSADWKAGEVL